MRLNRFLTWLVIAALVWGVGLYPPRRAQAAAPGAASAYDLILAMNTLRASNGLPALIEDPTVDAVAQATAQIMAANEMSWHIGDVRGRLVSAGYGGGGTVWATENFAVGLNMGINEIMSVWADPDHMLPAVTAAYCNVGAGVAVAPNGMTYYILQAAYVSGQTCGSASSSSGSPSQSGSSANAGAPVISQYIAPVKVATPDADGKIYHIVQAGQSFWAIAIAYHLKIADLESWNNLSRSTPLRAGQKLFIPSASTAGYATPTPVGMIAPSTPDADGKIVHTVQPYQALITIAAAYGVSVSTILALNNWQEDWPLQVGQKLFISLGSVTPGPTLSPLEQLTPESDGQYYHIVKSGETLSWIAGQYGVSLSSLMRWNGLTSASIIRPDQKLLLLVTPPATATPTPAPATITPTPTATSPLPGTTPTETPPAPSAPLPGGGTIALVVLAAILLLGGFLWLTVWIPTHHSKTPPE